MISSMESYRGIEFTIVEKKIGRYNISLFCPEVKLGDTRCQLWGKYTHGSAVLAAYKRIDAWVADMEAWG
jgi:hypothetical protein